MSFTSAECISADIIIPSFFSCDRATGRWGWLSIAGKGSHWLALSIIMVHILVEIRQSLLVLFLGVHHYGTYLGRNKAVSISLVPRSPSLWYISW